jgi:tRNA(Ile)-lysidine synthase
MLKNGDNVIIALSGGADSVCLLLVLLELGYGVSACHINHNLRKDESKRDENFCLSVCDRLNVPLQIHSIDVKSAQKKHQSTEECARELRYDIFCRYGSRIALAHNLNDNAETVMLNLIRGTGLKGLCGIPPVRENIIRPLINCGRTEIEQYLLQKNESYITDSTNLSDYYSRNKVRRNILPAAEEINPAFLKNIARMNGNLRMDEEYFAKIVTEITKTAETETGLAISALTDLPKSILRRIISAELTRNKISPSEIRIAGIEEIILSGKGKVNIARNKFAVVKKGLFGIITLRQNYRLDKLS